MLPRESDFINYFLEMNCLVKLLKNTFLRAINSQRFKSPKGLQHFFQMAILLRRGINTQDVGDGYATAEAPLASL